MIRIRAIRNLFNLSQPEAEEYQEQAIIDVDDDGLDYEDQYYTGVPAAPYLVPDPWFGNEAPPYTEKQLDYMEKETEIKKQDEARREESGEEPVNIHEVMYEIATKNTPELGGSENLF